MKESVGDYVVIMDDDFQHNPKDITLFIFKIIESGSDAVIADLSKKKHSKFRNLGLCLWILSFHYFIANPRD